ncbi:MAG: DUF1501 domain-containing protein [Pirellulaceae bacterium]|nr:DUF1501 domain-containing protein [Pirellulaceae bacterium]
MNASLHRQSNVTVNRQGRVVRRDFLRAIPLAGLAAGTLNWSDAMTVGAEDLRQQGTACILLWMQGGPSQFETFSPKPNHENGGETRAIPTSVSGIHIAENLPEIATKMDDLCLIRSMNSREGSHPRASYLMHTGYLPTASVKYPSIGSHVAHQIGDVDAELPSFVRIGRARGGSNGGFLGVGYDPFVMAQAGRMPENTTLTTTEDRHERRVHLMDRLETSYRTKEGQAEVREHHELYQKASRLVLSPNMNSFDINQEPIEVREMYGQTSFGQGCLLARRLVETGVTFVEVALGNWDTHQDNFERSAQLCEQLDRGYAGLIQDLKDRGMLDKTLVVWMGEFGRTPRINPRGGRDHFPRAFNVALAGGGVRGGQVIGETDAAGESVTARNVQVTDLFRTIFHGLNIDPDHENMSGIGRPIKIVDGGETVQEVFS